SRTRFRRRLIALDVVHNGIHVDDFDCMSVTDNSHERLKHAIAGFDQGNRNLKWFPGFDPLQEHNGISQSSLMTDDKVMQQAPPAAIGDTAAIGRIRKGNQIEPLRLRHRSIENHCPLDSPTMLYVYYVIGLCRREWRKDQCRSKDGTETENTRDNFRHRQCSHSNERYYGVCSWRVGRISSDFPSASNP